MDIAKHPKIQLSHRKIKIQIHFDFIIIFYDNNVLSIVYGQRSCCKFIIQLSHRKIKIQIHFDFFIIFYNNNVLSIVYGRSCCKFIGRQEHTNVTSQMYFLLK